MIDKMIDKTIENTEQYWTNDKTHLFNRGTGGDNASATPWGQQGTAEFVVQDAVQHVKKRHVPAGHCLGATSVGAGAA